MKGLSMVWVCILFSVSAMSSEAPPAEAKGCTRAREYITTLEFLREKQTFALKEERAREIANQVSLGCSGAAGRFIRVISVLSEAGAGGNEALDTALEMSAKTQEQAEVFLSIFKRAYLAEYLDLDLRNSIDLAKSLSSEMKSDLKNVRQDFEKLVDFCISPKTLDLPKPKCAQFAANVSRAGEAWHGSVAAPFQRVFEFLRSENGPSLSTGASMKLAEAIIGEGPLAEQNFVQAFKYAVSKSGLQMDNKDAIRFAEGLSLPKPSI